VSRKNLFFFSILCLILSGCGYTLVGQGNLPDHIKTIAIPTFENKTLEEGVEEIITQAVIEEFVQGGKVRLVSEENADAVLRGTVRSYKSDDVASYDENNDVSSYKLKIAVDIEITDMVNDKIIWQTEGLTEDEDFDGGPAVNITEEEENEEEALRDLAEELAQRIRALSTEGF
jgi:outer membrane lipopolysaccharide assembly protein LptE/RlpB